MGANLVGQGAGGGLKAWLAERERCNLFAAFKAPLAWLAGGGYPKRLPWAVRHRVPRFDLPLSKGATGSQRRCFLRWRVVKWCRGLLARVLAVPKRLGVSASLPACVCSGGGLRPTVRAADTASPCATCGGF